MRVTFPALFHLKTLRSAVNNYTFPDDLETRHAKVKNWAETLKNSTLKTIKETSLHGDFLGDIFRDALGYCSIVGGRGETWELHPEKHIDGGGGFADAAIGLFSATSGSGNHQKLTGRTIAPIELKGTKTDLDSRGTGRESPVEQGWRYANYTAGCGWVIVSNYRELRLYHTTKTPACCEQFFLEDLLDLEQFKVFYFLLCRDTFLPSSTDPQARSRIDLLLADSNEAEAAITEQLYQDYKDVRQQLVQFFKGRYAADWANQQAAFIEASQKILDRILFVAFCEDRGLLPKKTIQKAHDFVDIYNQSTIWQRFKAIFRWVDRGNDDPPIPGYNGGLFKADRLVDESLDVPDWLCKKLKNLAAYDFDTEVSVDVLGRIFEQSVTDLEELRSLAAGETYNIKQGKRKTQGVFYTPTWVTQYMVEAALGGYLSRRSAALRDRFNIEAIPERNTKQRQAAELAYLKAWREELKTIRILDPACGSGAFLIAAFNFLARHYEKVNSEIAALQGGLREIFDLNKAILNQNLYGVDLSFESVEITKLSLWLQTAERGQVLTNLDDNIKAGNSIVADPSFDPRAFDWAAAFPEVMADGGFDVVLGNPPYVRQELLSPFKPYLQTHYACYDGVADLYVYFYERGVKLLKSGGVLSYIVTNKWLRSGYGEALRKFFAEQTIFEQIIDFGHAPIFRDADTFPCIIVLRKADLNSSDSSNQVTVCAVPREQLENLNLAQFVEREGYEIPRSRLSAAAWSLENPQVEALMQKIRSVGIPLVDFVGARSLMGIKTGCNNAFLISAEKRQELIKENPSCSGLIKPVYQGKDLSRWSSLHHKFLILIPSSNNQKWDWSFADGPENSERIFSETYPAMYRHFLTYRDDLIKRCDQGKYWWELRDCTYYESFKKGKIFTKDLLTHPWISYEDQEVYAINTCYFWNTQDLYILGCLCSPINWWIFHRELQKSINDTLRMFDVDTAKLPIAPPTEPIRREAEDLVSELIELTQANQEATHDVMGWLAFEFNIDKPGQKLADFAQLSLDEFRAELKKRCPKGTAIGPKQVKAIDLAYADYATPIGQRNTAILQREQRLSDLVNAAYQLTPDEIQLLWKTAPPRMPIAPANQQPSYH